MTSYEAFPLTPLLSCLAAAFHQPRNAIPDKTVDFACQFDDTHSLSKRIGHLAWLYQLRSPKHLEGRVAP